GGEGAGISVLGFESRTDDTRDRSSFDVVVRRAVLTNSVILQSSVNGARAAATSPGLANRSSRSFASIFPRIAAISSGRSGRSSRIGGKGAWLCAHICCMSEEYFLLGKGVSPASRK